MRFGQEGIASYISASAEADLLRQVIAQQSNYILNYLPSASKAGRSLDLCRCPKVMQLRLPQSVNQSINRASNLLPSISEQEAHV